MSEEVVVGVDLAGSEKRPTGICILKGLRAETKVVYRDEELISEVVRVKPKVVAIDAPLSIPKGRKSIDERSPCHLRECDRELLRRGIKFFPVTLGPMRKLTKRGIRVREKLEGLGFRVIEVYPGGAQDVLGIPRKKRGVKALREGLEKLGIKLLSEALTDHELDAVTAAYVGKLFLEDTYEAYGDSSEGLIIMPRRSINS